MSLRDLVSLSGTPGLTNAVDLLTSSYHAIENVNVYKRQCQDLSARCVKLLLVLRDGSAGLEGQKTIQFVDEISRVIHRVYNKVNYWAGLGKVKSLLQQREIKDGIDSLHRDIDAAMIEFHLQNNMELFRILKETHEIHEQDRRETRNLLTKIVNDHNMDPQNHETPEQAEQLMESLQIVLREPDLQPAEMQAFQKSLWELHQTTSLLPPLVDLTGQIVRESIRPEARGTFNDIYSGKWLDREKVALRLPRLIQKPSLEERFQREILIWRKLKHPNIVPLYGTVVIHNDLYYVSPWMSNGTVMDFIRARNYVDRNKILHDVAKGLEYLHDLGNPIVHGDLRGRNVLVSMHGVACLSDFGLSKFLEDAESVTSYSVNPRWLAPELFRIDGTLSTQSDVWSFGMVCLEILTGDHPFAHIQRDNVVQHEIECGNLPTQPRNINNELWRLIKKCWCKNPKSRLSMSSIRLQLEKINYVPPNPPSTSSGSDSFSGSGSVGHIHSNPSSPPGSLDGHKISFSDLSLYPPLNPSLTPDLAPYGHSDVYDPIVSVDEPSGTIVGGTLDGLVERLIYSIDQHKDSIFQDIFFAAYTDFTTGENLFRIIIGRFFAVDRDTSTHPEKRAHLKYNIFKVLINWLKKPRPCISTHLRQQIETFCEHTLRGNNTARTWVEMAKQLLRLISDESETTLNTEFQPRRRVPRSSEMLPRDLAIALTIFEGDIYRTVFPWDYIAHLKRNRFSNSVERACFANNKIILWVKQSIVQCGNVNERAQALTFLINTAAECRKLRNFASLTAIASAVQSSTIERLKHTHHLLSQSSKRELYHLQKLVDPESRHQRYWEELNLKVGDESLDKCIPWLPVHLLELQAVFERNPPQIVVKGRRLINFQRCLRFMDRIKDMLYYEAPDLETYRRRGQLAYLEHALKRMDLNAVTEDSLEERSLALAEQEVQVLNTGEDALRRLGFSES